MKLPNKITICGKCWSIKKDPKTSGGWFDGSKSTISIGTKYKSEIPTIFLHEVIEATMTERLVRYRTYGDDTNNDGLRFVMTHKEYENICMDLAQSLRGIRI